MAPVGALVLSSLLSAPVQTTARPVTKSLKKPEAIFSLLGLLDEHSLYVNEAAAYPPVNIAHQNSCIENKCKGDETM